VYEVLDVLANQIGIKGLFTAWASNGDVLRELLWAERAGCE
jgi:hypothetical protein